MSVLIRDMEMPTSCADCRLMADGWCYSVGLEQREKISTVKRPTWCHLVPVPPHGRLIDADALGVTDFELVMCRGEYKELAKLLLEKIDAAPTIIPAEEGE